MSSSTRSRSHVVRFAVFAVAVAAVYWMVAYPRHPASAEATEIKWLSDFQTASALARSVRKPLLLDFSADWCPPCRQLESEVFTSKSVALAAAAFVPLRVDLTDPKPDSWQNALAQKYNVGPIPDIAIINPQNGALISRSVGFVPPDQMVAFLNKNAG